MAPLDTIEQGLGWLEDGEAPDAVAEEAMSQVSSASDKGTKAAWLVVAAEAYAAGGKAAEGIEPASEAVEMFKDLGAKTAESKAACSLASVQLAAMNWDEAVPCTTAAIDVSQEVGDIASTAAMFLKLAKGYLAQMRDPYVAARSALSAVEIYRQLGDNKGMAESLQTAAEGYLLYDPEEAMKVCKEAVSAFDTCCDFKSKVACQQLQTACRAQIAVSQQATAAASTVARGDNVVPYKWPKYAQQRGYPTPDPYIVEEYTGPVKPTGAAEKKQARFQRRSFKWTRGTHATDGAWYRQELHFVPPRIPQS
jgi:tetratricopeptide (TPR) repeat protein